MTVSIFLRELRDVWEKADPIPTPLVVEVAKHLGILKKSAGAEDTLKQLKLYWARNKVRGKLFVNFETSLLRLGKDYIRKGKSVNLIC